MANNSLEEITHKEEKKHAFKDPTFDVSINSILWILNNRFVTLFVLTIF